MKFQYRCSYPLEKAHSTDACFDVQSTIDTCLYPFERKCIPTGLYVSLPVFSEIEVRPRSGLALKHGITVLNTPGTIDSGYEGEVGVILINLDSHFSFTITKGMKIAQIAARKYEELESERVEFLESSSKRGTKGFGSSG